MALTEAQIAALPESLRRQFREEQKQLATTPKPQEAAQAVDETPDAPKPVIHNPDLRDQEPASAEPPVMTEQPTPPAPDPWEQRYRVLKGKYDAEIPNLANQLRQMQATVQAQADIIRGLKPAVDQGQPKAEPPKPVQGSIKPLNPEDYEHLGEEGQTLAITVNQLSQVIEAQQAEMRQLRGTTETLSRNTDRVVQDLGVTQHQTFLDSLKAAVPDCWEINENQDFRAWLDEPITVEAIGQNGQLMEKTVKRDDKLQAAQNSRNIPAIKRIFDEYKVHAGYKAPPPNGGGRPSPGLLIEPDTAGRGPTQHTKTKQPVTREQLEKASVRARTERTKEAIDAFNKLSSEYRATG